jgi:hypothetical protein
MMDRNVRRLDDVWTRFLAGEPIPREDRVALSAAVRSDDVLHRRLLHDLRLDGALRAAAQSQAGGEAFVQKLRNLAASGGAPAAPWRVAPDQPVSAPARVGSTRSKPALWMAAVAVCVVAMAALTLLRAPAVRPPAVSAESMVGQAGLPASVPASIDVRVVAATGQVRVYGPPGSVRAARVSDVIGPGEWLTTVGAGSRLHVEDADGTEIEFSGDTVATGLGFRPGQGSLFVARGRVRISLPPDASAPAPELISPHARITADACYRVEVSAMETRIESHRRRLRVASLATGRSVELRAGQYTIARADQLLPATSLWGVRRVPSETPPPAP